MLEGLENFKTGQEVFNEAGREFGKNTAKFSAAVATLDSIFNKDLKGELKDILKQLTRWTEVFTLSHITLTTKSLIEELDNTGARLSQTYGFMKSQRREVQMAISSQAEDLAKYGIAISQITDSTIALVSELKDFSTLNNKNLIRLNSLVQEVYGFSEDASARLIGSLKRFGGASEKDIRSFFEQTAIASKEMNVSYREVGDNISRNTHLITIFNMATTKSRQEFSKMAAYATAIGEDLGSAVEISERFLNIQNAIEGAGALSRFGITMDPLQLMQMAARGPAEIERAVLSRLSRVIGPEMQGTPYARLIAEEVGKQIGMSGPKVLDALNRHRKVTELMAEKSVSYQVALEEYAKNNMTIGQKFEALYKTVLTGIAIPLGSALLPVFQTVVGILTKIVDTIGGVGVLITAAISTLGVKIMSAMGASGLISGALGSGLQTALITGMYSKFTPLRKVSEALSDKLFPRIVGAEGIVAGKKLLPPRDELGRFQKVNKFGLPSPAKMMASAGAMIAFAGSLLVLSKAFQNFSNGVNWKGVGIGVTVMGAFVASMFAVTQILSVAAVPVALGTALLLGLAGAMWVSSKSFQNFSSSIVSLKDVDLFKVAKGIGAIGLSLAVLGASQTVSAWGSISSFFTGGSPLEKLGEWAVKFEDPIVSVSYAIERLAKSMLDLSVAVTAVDISKARQLSSELSSKNLSTLLVGKTIPAMQMVPIDNTVIVQLDGEKFMSGIIRTMGMVR